MVIRLKLPRPAETATHIEEFIREQMEKAGREKAVIALSGGVDSSLVATLAVRALGPERVIAHTLPDGEVTSEEDVQDAEELAKSLGILCRRISIHAPLETFRETFTEVGLHGDPIAWANVKPRLRMIVNYFVANFENGLVLGTGNKSEWLIGYFTKGGDGLADILPIGHLYKTQVRQLARFVGVPERIIDKPPSAGLWKGQTDEGEIGLSYEEIDKILYCLHDRRMSVNQTVKVLKTRKKYVQMIMDMMKASEHKRKLPPIPSD
jgi:NAD+ synthase